MKSGERLVSLICTVSFINLFVNFRKDFVNNYDYLSSNKSISECYYFKNGWGNLKTGSGSAEHIFHKLKTLGLCLEQWNGFNNTTTCQMCYVYRIRKFIFSTWFPCISFIFHQKLPHTTHVF